MGLSIIFLLGVLIIMIGAIIWPFIILYQSRKLRYVRKLTWVALCLLLINWIVYISDLIQFVPSSIAEQLFLPLWIGISLIGFFAGVKEWKNTYYGTLPVFGFSLINFLFAIFVAGITSM
ncbi:hypothetical protein [Aquibacillus kalidii]|uniref:hypothetical protein n=1 Tax=Aquibacillus kalidii TaxID=2762597 RepID=UPI001646BD06|nr:hypothetical protein [Aquibacillus kalidii]